MSDLEEKMLNQVKALLMMSEDEIRKKYGSLGWRLLVNQLVVMFEARAQQKGTNQGSAQGTGIRSRAT
jgi:hypothetical protein